MAFIAPMIAAAGTAVGSAVSSVGVGTLIGAAGSVVSGISALAAGKQQAQIAEENARIAKQNANRAIVRSGIEAQDSDMEARALLGEQEAVQSASGLNIGSPSMVLTRRASRRLARRDALNIVNAGQVEATNYKQDAANQIAQGSAAKAAGMSNALGSFISAAGSLAGSGSPTRKSSYDSSVYPSDPWVTNTNVNLRRKRII